MWGSLPPQHLWSSPQPTVYHHPPYGFSPGYNPHQPQQPIQPVYPLNVQHQFVMAPTGAGDAAIGFSPFHRQSIVAPQHHGVVLGMNAPFDQQQLYFQQHQQQLHQHPQQHFKPQLPQQHQQLQQQQRRSVPLLMGPEYTDNTETVESVELKLRMLRASQGELIGLPSLADVEMSTGGGSSMGDHTTMRRTSSATHAELRPEPRGGDGLWEASRRPSGTGSGSGLGFGSGSGDPSRRPSVSSTGKALPSAPSAPAVSDRVHGALLPTSGSGTGKIRQNSLVEVTFRGARRQGHVRKKRHDGT